MGVSAPEYICWIYTLVPYILHEYSDPKKPVYRHFFYKCLVEMPCPSIAHERCAMKSSRVSYCQQRLYDISTGGLGRETFLDIFYWNYCCYRSPEYIESITTFFHVQTNHTMFSSNLPLCHSQCTGIIYRSHSSILFLLWRMKTGNRPSTCPKRNPKNEPFWAIAITCFSQ